MVAPCRGPDIFDHFFQASFMDAYCVFFPLLKIFLSCFPKTFCHTFRVFHLDVIFALQIFGVFSDLVVSCPCFRQGLVSGHLANRVAAQQLLASRARSAFLSSLKARWGTTFRPITRFQCIVAQFCKYCSCL